MWDKVLDKQVAQGTISKKEKELYQYGYTLLLIQVINIAVLFIIGILLSCLPEMLLFLVVYIPLRSYAGGYHAKTMIACTTLSALLELSIAMVLKAQVTSDTCSVLVILSILAGIIIWKLAPVEAANKPLEQRQKARNRKKARMILVCELVALGVVWYAQITSVIVVITMSHIFLALLMVVEHNRTKK